MTMAPENYRIFESSDSEEISTYIRRIYSENQFSLSGAGNNKVTIVGQQWPGFGMYDFLSESPFSFAIHQNRENYLFSSCFHGQAYRKLGKNEALCKIGEIIPTSPHGEACSRSGSTGFGHQSLVIEAKSLQDFTSTWIGVELDSPLEMDLGIFSEDLAQEWKIASTCLQQMARMTPIPEFAIQSLIEHIFKILLHNHRSNYSQYMNFDHYEHERSARIALDRLKEDPMKFNTLTAIAKELGCPASTLGNGIRRITGKTYQELQYLSRLDKVHVDLKKSEDQSFVSIIKKRGFSLSQRFTSEYLSRYRELPSDTYQKNSNFPNNINEKSVDRRSQIAKYIDCRLSDSLSLEQLANFAGLSPQRTIEIFKEFFSLTPMQYVMHRRLEKARLMLEETNDSILSIALKCGFGSQSYLTSSMQRLYGTTPGRIRKLPHQ